MEESQAFAQQITEHMATLRRRVERLTEEQLEVIRHLRGRRRVRIAGCAGSGKTLIATEKAIRLSDAGLLTLFLCHSPLLAEHISHLTRGTGVTVASFCEWVDTLAGTSSEVNRRWTTYEEPSEDCLIKALAHLEESTEGYEAIIVDEGQDFRSEWWGIVEAALKDPRTGILYIFHDDNQALLTHRAIYPIPEQAMDLSRNCRNAGKIYDLLRLVHPNAPAADQELECLGARYLKAYSREDSKNEIRDAVRWLAKFRCEEPPVVLVTSRTSFDQGPFAGLEVETSAPTNWQQEVRTAFARVSSTIICQSDKRVVLENLEKLSQELFPNSADVGVVQETCGLFKISADMRRAVKDHGRGSGLTWKMKDGRVRLWRRHRSDRVNASDVVLFFEQDNWHENLPKPDVTRFHDALAIPTGKNSIPVHHVSEFKGLEAELVLVLADGPAALTKSIAYVGMSRARFALALLADKQIASSLPYAVRDLVLRGICDSPTSKHGQD